MAAITHKGCESIYKDKLKKLDEERKRAGSQRLDCFQAAGRYLADLERLGYSVPSQLPTYVKKAFQERTKKGGAKVSSKRKSSEPRKPPKEKTKKVVAEKRNTGVSLQQSRKKRALEATRKRFGGLSGGGQTNEAPTLSYKQKALMAVRKRFGSGGGIQSVEMPIQSRKQSSLEAVRKRFVK